MWWYVGRGLGGISFLVSCGFHICGVMDGLVVKRDRRCCAVCTALGQVFVNVAGFRRCLVRWGGWASGRVVMDAVTTSSMVQWDGRKSLDVYVSDESWIREEVRSFMRQEEVRSFMGQTGFLLCESTVVMERYEWSGVVVRFLFGLFDRSGIEFAWTHQYVFLVDDGVEVKFGRETVDMGKSYFLREREVVAKGDIDWLESLGLEFGGVLYFPFGGYVDNRRFEGCSLGGVCGDGSVV